MRDSKERRRIERMPVDYEVFVTRQGRLTMEKARDISTHGIGILTNLPLAPGEVVDLKVMIPTATMNIETSGVIKYCIKLDPGAPFNSVAGIEFKADAQGELPVAGQMGKKSRYTPSHTVNIDAPAECCYRAIFDFPRYPEWASTVESVPVHERYPDGRAKKLTLVHSIYFTKLRYLLDYDYDDSIMKMSWRTANADELVQVTGSYVFRPLAPEQTAATFSLDVTLNFPISSRLSQYLTAVVMRKELKGFKKFVEKNKDSWRKG